MVNVGLFVSGFERAMYKELMDSSFLGDSLVAQVPLSDIIFDFCASVSHNKDIFPNGVEKKKRERVLYASYALGSYLSGIFASDEETDQVAKAAFNGFKRTAINSGASQSLVVDRLGLIMQCINSANELIDKYGTDDAKSETTMKIAYLRMFDVEPTEQTINGLTDEIEKYYEVFQDFLLAHS